MTVEKIELNVKKESVTVTVELKLAVMNLITERSLF